MIKLIALSSLILMVASLPLRTLLEISSKDQLDRETEPTVLAEEAEPTFLAESGVEAEAQTEQSIWYDLTGTWFSNDGGQYYVR